MCRRHRPEIAPSDCSAVRDVLRRARRLDLCISRANASLSERGWAGSVNWSLDLSTEGVNPPNWGRIPGAKSGGVGSMRPARCPACMRPVASMPSFIPKIEQLSCDLTPDLPCRVFGCSIGHVGQRGVRAASSFSFRPHELHQHGVPRSDGCRVR